MATSDDPGYRAEQAGERVTGAHDETKWAPLTTEFWAMVILMAALLIAAAVSDSFEDRRAWLLVTVIGAAYIVSRGIAKAGTERAGFATEPAQTVRRVVGPFTIHFELGPETPALIERLAMPGEDDRSGVGELVKRGAKSLRSS